MSKRTCLKKPPLEFKKTEELITDTEYPLDISFKGLKELKGNFNYLNRIVCVCVFF